MDYAFRNRICVIPLNGFVGTGHVRNVVLGDVNLAILIYSLLVLIVCSISYFRIVPSRTHSPAGQNIMESESTSSFSPHTQWGKILLLTIILGIYSASLGTLPGLVDRGRYVFSFSIRYHAYYHSLEAFLSSRTEPGYLLLNFLVWKLTQDSFWLFFLVTAIYMLLSLYVMEQITTRNTLVIFLMLVSLFYFQSTYLLRQALAVGITGLALLANLKRNYWGYFLLTALACLFHITAIVMIPLFFVIRYSRYRSVYIFFAIAFLVSFWYFGPAYESFVSSLPYFEQYFSTDALFERGSGSLAGVIKGTPYYLLSVMALLNRQRLRRSVSNADFLIISSIVCSMSWLSTYNMYWFFRMGWYTLLPTLVLVAHLMDVFKPAERVLLYMIFIIPVSVISFRYMYLVLR